MTCTLTINWNLQCLGECGRADIWLMVTSSKWSRKLEFCEGRPWNHWPWRTASPSHSGLTTWWTILTDSSVVLTINKQPISALQLCNPTVKWRAERNDLVLDSVSTRLNLALESFCPPSSHRRRRFPSVTDVFATLWRSTGYRQYCFPFMNSSLSYQG